MTDESKEQKQDPAPVVEPEKLDRKAVEEHPAFKGVAKRKAELEAELAEMKAAQKAAEEARLAEQGQWQKIAEQRAAELAAKDAAHARELLTRDADLALASVGFGHPVLRRGYVAEYLGLPATDRPTLADWAEKIKADPVNAPLFSSQQVAPPVGAGPAGIAAPRAGAAKSLEQLKKDLANPDERIAGPARKEIRALRAAGKLPAGY